MVCCIPACSVYFVFFHSPFCHSFEGPGQDNIAVAARGSTLRFAVWRDGQSSKLEVPNVVEAAKITKWTVGVRPDATMFVKKDGVLLKEGPGQIPANVPREFKLVGESTFDNDPLMNGAVLGVAIKNEGEEWDRSLMSETNQIYGEFTAEATVMFRKLRGRRWQRGALLLPSSVLTIPHI